MTVAGFAFVFTSNVDGLFQKADFDPARIVEVHGTIHELQCTVSCGVGLFSTDGVSVDLDPHSFRALPPLPACPRCGSLARPSVLMFGDPGWDPARTEAQEERLSVWLRSQDPAKLVVIEVGAGGRFDMTNVLPPAVSVITSVGLDHTDTLGPTIAEIAWHKAGIIKDSAPVVTSRRGPGLGRRDSP